VPKASVLCNSDNSVYLQDVQNLLLKMHTLRLWPLCMHLEII